MLKVIPESTKQGTATAVLQDLLLIAQPWSFSLSSIPEALQSAIQIWHGTEDLQVSCWSTLLGKADTSPPFSSNGNVLEAGSLIFFD